MLSSPFIHTKRSTPWVMQQVALALMPAIVTSFYFYGWAVLSNIVLMIIACLAFEAFALTLRKRSLVSLGDWSAVVTALLLAMAIPPAANWWLIVVGAGLAMLLAKHLYGGLGLNPFNPAMVAYVVLLISYPVQMSQWIDPAQSALSLSTTLDIALFGSPIDQYTGATALDAVRHNAGLTISQLAEQNPATAWGAPHHFVSLSYLLGGLYLLARRIIFWQLPIALILGVLVAGVFVYDGSSESALSPAMQLAVGGTLMGAFFIITDPVSSPTTTNGRLIAGAFAGVLIVVIRHFGNYPDAVAFAVLLVNLCAPLIDYFTLPRTYGHSKAKRATDE